MRRIKTPLGEYNLHQTFNSGTLNTFRKKLVSEPGDRPEYEKDYIHRGVFFEDRSITDKKVYYTMQEGTTYTRIVRVPFNMGAETGDGIEIGDMMYIVKLAQPVMGVYPPCMDMSIERKDGIDEINIR